MQVHALAGRCIQMAGKSEDPLSSTSLILSGVIGKLNWIALYGLKVSTRPGPQSCLSFDEGELLAERKQRLLDPREDDVAIEETLDDVEIAANSSAVDR